MKKDSYSIFYASYSKDCEEVFYGGTFSSFEEALTFIREDIEAVKKNVIKMIPNIKAYLEEPQIILDEISDYQITCRFAYDEPDGLEDCQYIFVWMITNREPNDHSWEPIFVH